MNALDRFLSHVVVALLSGMVAVDAAEAAWRNPLVNRRKLNSPLVEVTPFVFQDRLYLLENWQKQWEHPGSPDGSHFQEDEVRVRDVKAEKIVSTALTGHGLGCALAWQGRVHVFAGDWGKGDKKWGIQRVSYVSSSDLKTWTVSRNVLCADSGERLFNVSVCRGDDRFILLAETDNPRWPPFTFKYYESTNLTEWRLIPDALYGTNKYVGGPAVYHEGGWYYTLYLESLGSNRYETRITRSRDLRQWNDAPDGRAFVTFNPTQRVHPLRPAHVRESNASDAEVVYWKGTTLVYFTGGDQQLAGDLQMAEFPGTPRALFEKFFE
jgi:alpha-L-fucosidase